MNFKRLTYPELNDINAQAFEDFKNQVSENLWDYFGFWARADQNVPIDKPYIEFGFTPYYGRVPEDLKSNMDQAEVIALSICADYNKRYNPLVSIIEEV